MQQPHDPVASPFLPGLALGDVEPDVVHPVAVEDDVAVVDEQVVRREIGCPFEAQPFGDEIFDAFDHIGISRVWYRACFTRPQANL